ncbi:MAG: tetraprenyl-beta-curcumene synthase family protein, partial [Candidatus Eremiobacteraeota bacterium]|nr:tetraprenyl-beta-curcumene synthase family protein [Candidatus Eremiobacteraeota bacterium]
YAAGPEGDDGKYLEWLVTEVRDQLSQLPALEHMKQLLRESARLYTDLQTFKHYPPAERQGACRAWYDRNRASFSDYTWWEFASACGSQLQVYILFFLAVGGETRERSFREAYDAYFPALAAIHVLLDSFIDQREDREHNELSLINCYRDTTTMLSRMRTLRARCHERSKNHFVLQVMSLFYLTHPKVFAQGLNAPSQALLAALA